MSKMREMSKHKTEPTGNRSSRIGRASWMGLLLWSAQAGQAQTAPPLPVSPVPVTQYEYDAQGNPTKTVQAPGVSGYGFATQTSYDSLSRAKDVTDARSKLTVLGYDGQDRSTSVTDPRSLTTSSVRNGLGDVNQLSSPDTGTTGYTYDGAGNLKTRTDSRGVLATYSHDTLNRLTQIVYSKTGQTSRTYSWNYDETGTGFANGTGRLTSTAHPSGSTQYSYDPQGRLLSDTQRIKAAAGANASQISKTVTYEYDAAGHITSVLYPSGRKLTISYSEGRPRGLKLAKNAASTAQSLITMIEWDPSGQRTSWRWQMASGAQTDERVYDLSGRPVRYRLGAVVRDLSYDAADRIIGYTHYDAASQTVTPAASALDQSFGYNQLGRLTSITTASTSASITYDDSGNRKNLTLNGTASVYTTAADSNRLKKTTNPLRNFSYDDSGNTEADGQYTATYDLAGRLATLAKAGLSTAYSIDGFGRRIRKANSSGAASTIVFVYDQQGQLLGEYDQTGTPMREYVWLGNTPVAVFTPDPAGASNAPLTYYIHTDHLGAPRVVVDKNNAIRWRWLAEPFGTTAPETDPSGLGPFTFPLRLPGQYADQESGLSYNWFRDYDPSIGRYVQSDPIGLEGGINTYAYVGGNPLSYSDPNGLVADVLPLPPIRIPALPGVPGWILIPFLLSGDTPSDESCRNRCRPATPENVRAVIGQGGPWRTLQPSISASHIQNLVNAIESGAVLPSVKADGYVIVDGNHTFIATFLCGKGLSIQPYTAPLTKPSIPIRDLQIMP